MNINGNDSKEKQENNGLLISILMRYPEIGAISFNPLDNTISLSFSCGKVITDEEFEKGRDRLKLCLETYSVLENKPLSSFTMDCIRTDEISVLKINHNIEVTTKNEIALIIDFLQDQFGDCLLKEQEFLDFQGEEELLLHDEFITHMLENFKNAIPIDKLIAYREEGKVHLFKKQF